MEAGGAAEGEGGARGGRGVGGGDKRAKRANGGTGQGVENSVLRVQPMTHDTRHNRHDARHETRHTKHDIDKK